MSEVARLVEKKLAVIEFDPFAAKLAEFREKYADVVYDLSDPAQEKKARSDRLAIGKVIARLDDKHKELKAPLKARVDIIDGERKRIKDDLLAIQEQIKAQIAAHEKALQDAENALQMRIADIRALMVFDAVPTLEAIAGRLTAVKAVEIDHTFEHLINQAAMAKLQTLETLERLHADTLAEAEAAAEKARIAAQEAAKAQQEHDERIAAEAAEKARLAAEAAAAQAKADAEAAVERERQATLKAQQDAAEAAERAAREARRAAEAAEQAKADAVAAALKEAREKAEQEKAEREKARLEQEAREADEAHRDAVNSALTEAFAMEGKISISAACKIVSAIALGDIPNIKIIY